MTRIRLVVVGVVNGWFKYAGIIPSIDPDCPPGVPGFECGDLKNKVNLNRSGEVDSEADQIFYYADFALSDELSLRYKRWLVRCRSE